MKNTRLYFIDWLESLAILFVLIYHCSIYTFDFQTDGTLMNYFLYFSRTILSTCVPLFFFINGYLLLSRKFDIKKHVYKCIRLVVLTFIWSFILIISTMFISNKLLSIKEIILKVLYPEIGWTNLLWYLGALVSIYIFFPILKTAFDTNKKSFLFFSVICIFFTFGVTFINQAVAILGVFTPVKIDTVWFPVIKMFNPFRGFIAYALAYFCIGGVAFLLQDKILSFSTSKRNTIAIITIILSCLGLFSMGVVYTKYINTEIFDVVWDGYDSIFTLTNVICLYILSINYKKGYKIIGVISRNTLGIYFIHEILIRLTKSAIQSISIFNNIFFNLIYAIIILLISLLITLLIKRIPLIKKLV